MQYVVFFRGINVGGKNIVKMADLAQLFAKMGFTEVKTYIQSGNVIFASDEKDKPALIRLITDAFASRFGFESAVILRSGIEIANVLASLPFTAAEIESAGRETPGVEHSYIYLSNGSIDGQRVEALCSGYCGKDKLHIAESEIYLLCHQSIRDSKLAAMLTKLPQPLTCRNMKTMERIHAMM